MSIKEAFFLDTIRIGPVRCVRLKRELDAANWSEKKPDSMEEAGDPNGHHWDAEAAFRYLFRGAKLELEKPEEQPENLSENESLEWKSRAHRRRLKATEQSEQKSPVFEY